MSRLAALRPALPLLLGASLLLTFAMGLRQSLGIFMPSLTRDIGIPVADFTLAIAVQNLSWGVLQPFAGALAVRVGYRPLMLGGAVVYIAGLVLLASAGGLVPVIAGAGLCIGLAMACTGPAMAMAVAARAVPAAVRSTVLGIVSAAGSLGAMVAAPVGQLLMQQQGWRIGLVGFTLMALVMLPAAWFAGRGDREPLPAYGAAAGDETAAAALRAAFGSVPFLVMAAAYFVCGMQLIFLTTHLPAYLEICGMDPMLSAQALGCIGAFNVLGSLFFGWAGGRWNKLLLLGLIYTLRSATLAWYFLSVPTPASTLFFASVMGFLWLGVGPLVAGWIVDRFGLRWQAMLGGVAFVSHQVGSFAGAYGGGLLFDALGNYTLAWQIGVAVGLAAGIAQIAFAFAARARPPGPTPAAA
ncbi:MULTISPECIES: MFS transporter [Ramlibacter]|uniref:MFS transporter n=1 Tax=Ramlibacter pinisoli TaxID=2682844 RepID=A0A6N8IQP6_9BURK|nr:MULTISPECIES: MFS transporter [Ramlibacter]MBA2963499.1 MFS transporter [Ramlibacter sp. CGMCC 1.13660]MVQ28466.1 MFS transporter [Ramlibacter pinisoli]